MSHGRGRKWEKVLWEPIMDGVLLPALTTFKCAASLNKFYRSILLLHTLFKVPFLKEIKKGTNITLGAHSFNDPRSLLAIQNK